jgi:DNA-binding FadR family transcriptional regulator
MQHFVSNVHNYILVEVLESAWTVFIAELRQAKDLDELISLQKKFVSDILDKALLSEAQRELYKLLQRLLNNVFMFTLIKEKYFFKSAL